MLRLILAHPDPLIDGTHLIRQQIVHLHVARRELVARAEAMAGVGGGAA